MGQNFQVDIDPQLKHLKLDDIVKTTIRGIFNFTNFFFEFLISRTFLKFSISRFFLYFQTLPKISMSKLPLKMSQDYQPQ